MYLLDGGAVVASDRTDPLMRRLEGLSVRSLEGGVRRAGALERRGQLEAQPHPGDR